MATKRENYINQLGVWQREYNRHKKQAESYEAKINELLQKMKNTPDADLDTPAEG